MRPHSFSLRQTISLAPPRAGLSLFPPYHFLISEVLIQHTWFFTQPSIIQVCAKHTDVKPQKLAQQDFPHILHCNIVLLMADYQTFHSKMHSKPLTFYVSHAIIRVNFLKKERSMKNA